MKNILSSTRSDSSEASLKTYEWNCKPSPCFLGVEQIILIDSPNLSVPRSRLIPGAYKFTLSMTEEMRKTALVASDSAFVFLTPGSHPVVVISGPVGAVSPGSAVTLTGAPRRYVKLAYSYLWRQVKFIFGHVHVARPSPALAIYLPLI